MIRNLIFDFGKVLVDYDFDAVIDSYFETESDRIGFKQVVMDPKFVDETDMGVTSFQDIMKREQRLHPQWAEAFELFDLRFTDFIQGEVPGMRDLLIRFHREGFRLYGLTNWSNTVYRVIEKYDILQMMDDRLISSEEMIIKPDVRIYHRLCDKFGLDINECLFTDDKQLNIDGALKAGMKAVLFKNAEQYERDVEQVRSGRARLEVRS